MSRAARWSRPLGRSIRKVVTLWQIIRPKRECRARTTSRRWRQTGWRCSTGERRWRVVCCGAPRSTWHRRRALWALRWVEEVRANSGVIVRASEAAEREAENIVWLLDSGSCSEYVQHTLRNALQQCDDVHGWYGDALQTVDDLRAKYDGWLSDMHRAHGTEGDDAALASRLAAWRAPRPRH